MKKPMEMTAVRLDPVDRKRVKAFAGRLGVREADLMRYAIKLVLQELSPLSDQACEGAELIEPFLVRGPYMARWLELDERRLDAILHTDLEDEGLRVSAEDMRMIITGGYSRACSEWQRDIEEGKATAPLTALTQWAYLYEKYVAPIVGGKLAEEAHLQAQRFKR